MEILNNCDKLAFLPDDVKRIIYRYMSHKVADIFRKFNKSLTKKFKKRMNDFRTDIICRRDLIKYNDLLPKGFNGGYFNIENTIWNNKREIIQHKYISLNKFWIRKMNDFEKLGCDWGVAERKSMNTFYGLQLRPNEWERHTIKYYRKIAEQNNIRINKNSKKKDVITALIKGA